MSTESFVVPARGGRAVSIRQGQHVKVINTHGTQVLDTWAFNLDDPSEYMSMEHTRSRLSRLSPRTGDKLFSNRRRPILALLEDTSPGIHDTLLCACNKEIYRELGCDDGHRSCESNLHEALSFIGLEIAVTPGPLNLFMNVPVASDGTIDRAPPLSRPGDLVTLQTVMDTIVVFSACPQDVTPINGAQCIPRDAHYTIIAR